MSDTEFDKLMDRYRAEVEEVGDHEAYRRLVAAYRVMNPAFGELYDYANSEEGKMAFELYMASQTRAMEGREEGNLHQLWLEHKRQESEGEGV
jgi:hypothetical protein